MSVIRVNKAVGTGLVVAGSSPGSAGIGVDTTDILTRTGAPGGMLKFCGDGSTKQVVWDGTWGSKTIVDGSATSLFDVACASGSRCTGALFYSVFASDGTDHQAMSGLVTYSAVNKAGTLTLTITNATGNDAKAVSAGTLTLAWTFVTGTSKGTVKLQPTGSLTETTYTVQFMVLPLAGAVTLV